MRQRSWVRAMKCQLLAASLFIMLLGLSVNILSIVTYCGKHFTVIKDASLDKNAYYRTFHSVVFYTGICIGIILTVASLLSIVATVRELESGMAVGFFCFAVVFCASIQATYWTITNSAVVEDAMMDVYDFVYEDVRRNTSSTRREELRVIHKTFLCCGKRSPFGEKNNIGNEVCQSEMMESAKQLAGGIILGVALWLRHDTKTTTILGSTLNDHQAPSTYYVGIYILIAVGAVMMFVGFLGCYGAIQESQCLLGTFFTCLVILFACEVAAGIWGFVNKDQIAKDVKQFYDEAVLETKSDNENKSKAAKAVVKTFHETLKCCGTGSFLEHLYNLANPDDLCSKGQSTIFTSDLNCHARIDELFSGKLYLIGIAAIVVAVIMIFEMILSMVLCCGIRNSSVY
uniref:CD81 molecule n=1 Tax=Anolis carolinensis TaxID=28377 RepID=A0A803SXE7_ANOCA